MTFFFFYYYYSSLLVLSIGKIGISAVTSTELGYLSGVTSNIQDQLNGKADSDTLFYTFTSRSSFESWRGSGFFVLNFLYDFGSKYCFGYQSCLNSDNLVRWMFLNDEYHVYKYRKMVNGTWHNWMSCDIGYVWAHNGTSLPSSGSRTNELFFLKSS